MVSAVSSDNSADRAALIHREVIQLAVLVFIAVGAFFVTKAVAANNRNLSMRNADEWYQRGEQLAEAGRLDQAVDAFRRAMVRNRTNRTYLLALSRALAQKRDYESARTVLLTVRASEPEDAEVNLELARVSAARQDVTEALRFFRDALYAPWRPDQGERRRAIRLELIRFLLTHDQASRAQAELVAASVDSPDDVAHHLELADLFNQAGDGHNALAHFQRVLRLAPENVAALLGAGRAAFDLGEYPLARRYLREVPSDVDAAREIREVADQVVSRDPIAGRIGARERHRRLEANLTYLQQRLVDCNAQHGQSVSGGRYALQNDLQSFRERLRRSPTLDQDTIEAGVDLIDRTERDAIASCGSSTAVDRALVLIAKQHGAASQ
jgi:tetratricopeptide (TPR) repeat protein